MTSPARRVPLALTLAACLGVGLAACSPTSSPDDPGQASASASASATSSPTPSPSSSVRQAGAVTRDPSVAKNEEPLNEKGAEESGGAADPLANIEWQEGASKSAASGPGLLLTDVRAGTHPGFYRLVAEFAGEGEPGWEIDWTDQALEMGRGKPLPIPTGNQLQIFATGIRVPVTPAESEAVYAGAADKWFDDNGTVAWFDTVFEGRAQFAFAMPERHPYRVFTLTDPVRLVIDVKR